jgi:hypothetical protein
MGKGNEEEEKRKGGRKIKPQMRRGNNTKH